MSESSLAGVELLLHDAFLTLSSTHLANGEFSVLGYSVRPAGLFRRGKYQVRLRLHGVRSYEVIDEARIDQIDVDTIAYSEGVVSIRGKMPVEIRAHVDSLGIEAELADVPFATKRMGRWKVVAAAHHAHG